MARVLGTDPSPALLRYLTLARGRHTGRCGGQKANPMTFGQPQLVWEWRYVIEYLSMKSEVQRLSLVGSGGARLRLESTIIAWGFAKLPLGLAVVPGKRYGWPI